MRLIELSILYMVVGTGLAVVHGLRTSRGRGRAVGDGLLLVAFWPLYAPFLWSASEARSSGLVAGFHSALEHARHSPLADVLPDRSAALSLSQSLRRALEQRDELSELLSRPEFSEEAALARQQALRESGQTLAATTAESRVTNIRRLKALRVRRDAELAAVQELLVQLQVQAEVVRLMGQDERGPASLVGELVARIEGLDAVLDDHAPMVYDSP